MHYDADRSRVVKFSHKAITTYVGNYERVRKANGSEVHKYHLSVGDVVIGYIKQHLNSARNSVSAAYNGAKSFIGDVFGGGGNRSENSLGSSNNNSNTEVTNGKSQQEGGGLKGASGSVEGSIIAESDKSPAKNPYIDPGYYDDPEAHGSCGSGPPCNNDKAGIVVGVAALAMVAAPAVAYCASTPCGAAVGAAFTLSQGNFRSSRYQLGAVDFKNGVKNVSKKQDTKKQDKLSSPNPLPKSIRTAYEEIKLGRGVPFFDKNGVQKIFEGRQRENKQWAGATEWLVPNDNGAHHRVLQLGDKLGYAKNHNYNQTKAFPGPWYSEGGKK